MPLYRQGFLDSIDARHDDYQYLGTGKPPHANAPHLGAECKRAEFMRRRRFLIEHIHMKMQIKQ